MQYIYVALEALPPRSTLLPQHAQAFTYNTDRPLPNRFSMQMYLYAAEVLLNCRGSQCMPIFRSLAPKKVESYNNTQIRAFH